jgi:hypothetical protein
MQQKECFFNLWIAIICEELSEQEFDCNPTKLLDLSLSSLLCKAQLNSLYRQMLLCTP